MSNILFTNALEKKSQATPPIWFMRQAGRYHQHYQKLKEQYSFEQLCKTPELAAEVASGPVREFDFDVAILFSDILFILEGLGLGLKFNPGPQFSKNINSDNMHLFTDIDKAIQHIYFQAEALKITKEKIPNSKSLIGFVGGLWTLLCFAVGKDKKIEQIESYHLDFMKNTLLPLLKLNIKLQLDAGAETVMMFDSNLYDLNSEIFKSEYYFFLKNISEEFPNKVGFYSRGKNFHDLKSLFSLPFAGMGFDHTIDLSKLFHSNYSGFVQGNFNEQFMLLEKNDFINELNNFIKIMLNIPNRDGWICGLGHGINKNTPEKHVHIFLENIRKNFS